MQDVTTIYSKLTCCLFPWNTFHAAGTLNAIFVQYAIAEYTTCDTVLYSIRVGVMKQYWPS